MKLTDLAGRWVILYFYPRDETPSCTREACDFRDSFALLSSLGAAVLGCSADSLKAHDKFIAKHDLPFTLLSDLDHEIARKYGVWKEKNMYGRMVMAIERSTFLIDPRRRIRRVWRRVKVEGHVHAIIDALKTAVA